MHSYSVFFTTKKIVTSFHDDGTKSTVEEDVRQVIHDIPHVTAQQYMNCDNFEMERYYPSMYERRPSPEKRAHGVASPGSGKIRNEDIPSYSSQGKPAAKPAPVKNKILEAARTGDLAAAINEEAA